MRIGVVGCGNVGFNTMKAFLKKNHEVLGYDIAEQAQKRISTEFGVKSLALQLEELILCDSVFVCVPTDPVGDTQSCDLRIFSSVVDEFSSYEYAKNYRCNVFVQRSTCPPGTARQFAKKFVKTSYAVNPSFLRKKTQWKDSINPERIAIGGGSSATSFLEQIYAPFGSPIFTSDCFETIEFLKYCENIVDVVLISLWNEFLSIADSVSIPRNEFSRILNCMADRDKFRSVVRVPGQAFGMWCLPKDIFAIVNDFSTLKLNVINGAIETNMAVSGAYGENTIAGSDLVEVFDGRLKLTQRAEEYLLQVRFPDATFNELDDLT